MTETTADARVRQARARQARDAARAEMELLTAQAEAEHQSNLASEHRRHARELEHIQRVYDLRTEGL